MAKTKKSTCPVSLLWKAMLVLVVIAAALFPAVSLAWGEEVEKEVTFYEGQRWQLSSRSIVSEEWVEMAGGVEAVKDHFQTAIEEVQPRLAFSIRHWREDQYVVFEITAEGDEWQTLNELAFLGRAEITAINGEIRIQGYMHGLYSLTLHGARIIESNADQVIGGRAIWQHPIRRIEVTLTEKARLYGLVFPLIVLTALVIGVVAAFAHLGKRVSLA